MKKLFALLAAFAFSFGMYAQDGKMPAKDHIMMKDGKLWVMKDGQTSSLTQDITLSDGSIVNLAGKVTAQDGTSKTLSNGEAIDWDGMVYKIDEAKKDKPKKK